MTVALARASSLEEIYEQGINGVQEALKVDRASILLFDDNGVMKFKASRGLSKEYVQAVEGHSPWSREAVNPPPIGMKDIEEDPSVEAYRGIFRTEHIRALGFIPLWSSDGLLGKFMLYYDSPHQFTEEEIQVAQTIASHIAFMIQRKRAEEALRVSEERYARATAIGKVGVWQLDVASGKYHGDTNLKALFGYGPDELSTDPFAWLGLVHPDDQSIALKTWEQIVSGATDEYHYELRMIRKDGSIIWTHVRGHANRSKTGSVVQLIGATVDITDRKRAEEVLRLTQFSVDRAVDAVFWVAPDARILNVNEAACRMLEYSREELVAMTVHDIDPNFSRQVWPFHWDELKRKGSMTFESKHWSQTGRVLETEVTANYLQYEDREYNCTIMRDISERKRAERALHASEERYRTLYDDTPTMYFTLAVDGTVHSVNRYGAEQLGYRVEELVGHSVLRVFHDEDKETVATSLSECLTAPGATKHWEFRKVRKDGTVIWVRETARVGQSSTGETVVLVTCEDITERKRMEETLRQRERDLRAAVEERERISEDLHDGILQSIYAIGLGLEACMPLISDLPNKSAAKLNVALRQTIGQLNNVLEEVRNFIAGLESQILDGQDFDVVLQTMVHTLAAPYSIPCKIAIEKAAAQELSTEQAYHVMNIAREAMSNSLRHSEATRITVSLTRLSRSVRLSVIDNGVGFNPDTKHDHGHGLANMAARAQKLGGKFALQAKPHHGAKVLVDIPRRFANADS
jgi:PAS domain S-box-containing protein